MRCPATGAAAWAMLVFSSASLACGTEAGDESEPQSRPARSDVASALALPLPKRGLRVSAIAFDTSAADAPFAFTIETEGVFEPVATLRTLRPATRADAAGVAIDRKVIASAKCPAIVDALRSLRELNFRPMVGLDGELEDECRRNPRPECQALTLCHDIEYELVIVGSPRIEKRWSDNVDRDFTTWAEETELALRACPGSVDEAQ